MPIQCWHIPSEPKKWGSAAEVKTCHNMIGTSRSRNRTPAPSLASCFFLDYLHAFNICQLLLQHLLEMLSKITADQKYCLKVEIATLFWQTLPVVASWYTLISVKLLTVTVRSDTRTSAVTQLLLLRVVKLLVSAWCCWLDWGTIALAGPCWLRRCWCGQRLLMSS